MTEEVVSLRVCPSCFLLQSVLLPPAALSVSRSTPSSLRFRSRVFLLPVAWCRSSPLFFHSETLTCTDKEKPAHCSTSSCCMTISSLSHDTVREMRSHCCCKFCWMSHTIIRVLQFPAVIYESCFLALAASSLRSSGFFQPHACVACLKRGPILKVTALSLGLEDVLQYSIYS